MAVYWDDDLAEIKVHSPGKLLQLLDRIAADANPTAPPLVEVENERGHLTIGLGAGVSTLSHVPASGDPPYLASVGEGNAEGVIDFYFSGHHTQFARRNTISLELARAALLEYAEAGTLSDKVMWEEC